MTSVAACVETPSLPPYCLCARVYWCTQSYAWHNFSCVTCVKKLEMLSNSTCVEDSKNMKQAIFLPSSDNVHLCVRAQKYTTLCAPKLLLCEVYAKINETAKLYVWRGIKKYATRHVYHNEHTSYYFLGNALFHVAHCCHTLPYIMWRVVQPKSSKCADSNSFWIINFEQVYQKLQW